MILLLVLVGVMALALPGATRLSVAGHPRWFSVLNAVVLAVGMLASIVGLVLAVGVGAAHVIHGDRFVDPRDHLLPGGVVTAALACVTLAVVATRFTRWSRARRRVRRAVDAAAWLGEATQHGDHDVLVVPTSEPVAYATDGRLRQIVISTGLRDGLDGDALAFVLAHEGAHLDRRHGRHLTVASLAEALFDPLPFVVRSALALRLAVERVADDVAAMGTHTDSGRLALRSVGRRMSAPCLRQVIDYRVAGVRTVGRASFGVEAVAVAGLVLLTAIVLGTGAHATADLTMAFAAH